MIIANVLSGLAALLWLALLGYVAYTVAARLRGRDARVSISVALALLVAAAASSTLGAGVVVIDAGEVGVVFNPLVSGGVKQTPLYPGLHFVIPYVETVYRYSTLEQVYTMTKVPAEGEVAGDDSLWSPTSEGLQVGIDSSTRYKVNPAMAPYVHSNLRGDYKNIVVRPTIRSIVRLHVSQHRVTDVYGPMRREIQEAIEEDIRKVFEEEGLILLSFDIRNVNFTEEYARSIEQKQIAQQQAEQMQYVLQKERQEAERKHVEAEGVKQAAITRAEGEAEALRLVSQALAENPYLLTYRYIEKLAPNVQTILLPSDNPFILDLKGLAPVPEAP
ncbi:MAG: prohibitin family protein [Anaerolineae bacterium]|nr:prohibitin family protein [Anaerolineae bacterium]